MSKEDGFERAKVIQVIEVTVCAGDGTEADPHRYVRYYCTLDGELLAVADPARAVFP